MAETVLNMARSMLGSAVSKAASIAADEMSLMLGVRKEIWFIKDELKTIQAFLMAAEMMEKKDLLLKEWVEQVRDLSYDIEDCLDEFMVHVGSQSLLQRLMKLKDRHRIADQIRSLKSRVEEVSNRNTRYRLIKEDLPSTSCDMDSFVEDIRNLSGSNIDEAELVGFAAPKRKLLQLIDVHANHGPPRVIWVVGMGGLCHDPTVKNNINMLT
ncbi:putative disease resistance protein At1g50180 isoform X1 [Setaria italica]|uniref:putative disease resistance protein At1g50180 isoform X1 n=1 Tax=Setaria italica TaxID=4555 RepID=UPI000648F922|nr:putative disease resistance protein At1g50180 isoform X1 [Setaria italica]